MPPWPGQQEQQQRQQQQVPAPMVGAPQLLDQRGISKPPMFSGKRVDFEDWVFPFESYTAMLGWDIYLVAVAKAPNPITAAMVPADATGVNA